MPNRGMFGVLGVRLRRGELEPRPLKEGMRIEHPQKYNAKYRSVPPDYPRIRHILFHRISPLIHNHFTYYYMLRVIPTAPLP